MFTIVTGHHLQLSHHLPLFCNYKQVHIRAAVAHHPVIQEEVNDPLAKSDTDPSTGGVGFYFYVFLLPKHLSGLHLIFNLK